MTSTPAPAKAVPADMIGLAAAILGAALFSTKPILIKFAYVDGTEAILLLTLRMLCALPFYVIVGYFAYKRSGTLPPKLILATMANGLLGYYIASFLDFTALQEITAQLERLILFTYPIFVVLIGAAFFKQPIARWTIPAILVAYVGLAFVFFGNMDHPGTGNIVRGSILVLGAAFCFALFQLFGRELVRQIGPVFYTSIAMISASIGVMTHFTITRSLGDLAVSSHIWGLAFAIAVISTVIPSYLINFALGRVGATSTAMVGNAGPLFTIVMAAFLLSEPFGWKEATGTALVIGAMVLFTRK